MSNDIIEEQLSFVNELSELLVTENSDEFIQSIPQLICDFFKVDACVIWKQNFKQQEFTILANSSQVDSDYQTLKLSSNHPIMKSFLENKQISYIYDINDYCSKSRLFAQEEIKTRKWMSLLSCVIKDKDKILGIIDIFSQRNRRFKQWEMSLVNHIRHLITIAWQRNEQIVLKKLTEIIDQMSHTNDEKGIWQLLYDGAGELVDAEHWLIGKLAPSTGQVKIEKNSPNLKYPQQFDWTVGIIGSALKEEKTINVDDVSDTKWKNNYEKGWEDTKSEIAIPIMLTDIPIRKGTEIASATKLLGVLNIESDQLAHFSKKDQENLGLLARFAAIMIDKIESDEKLKKLRKVEKRIAQTQDYEKTINIVIQGIKNITKFSWVNISLINLERTLIETQYIDGIRDKKEKEEFKKLARHKLDSDDIHADIVKRRQIEVPESNDSRFDKEIFAQYQHQNLVRVFLPLIEASTDQVIGTLEVGYLQDYRKYIYEEDIQILKSFVDYLVDILELKKSGYIQRVIHELKSPIDGILAHADILQRRWEQFNRQDITLKLEDIMIDGNLLRYQVREVEYFLGKEAFFNPVYEQTDIFKEVFLKIINELKPIICNDYGFEFSDIHYDSNKMRSVDYIKTDKIMLNQVFFNLLMNALKYSKGEKIKKIELDVKQDNKELTIIFRDWGIGIEKKHQNDIFREGFRTPDAMKKLWEVV